MFPYTINLQLALLSINNIFFKFYNICIYIKNKLLDILKIKVLFINVVFINDIVIFIFLMRSQSPFR